MKKIEKAADFNYYGMWIEEILKEKDKEVMLGEILIRISGAINTLRSANGFK